MPQSRELQQALGLAAITTIITLWKRAPESEHLHIKITVMHELASVLRTLAPQSFQLRPWVAFVERGLASGAAELKRQKQTKPPQTQ